MDIGFGGGVLFYERKLAGILCGIVVESGLVDFELIDVFVLLNFAEGSSFGDIGTVLEGNDFEVALDAGDDIDTLEGSDCASEVNMVGDIGGFWVSHRDRWGDEFGGCRSFFATGERGAEGEEEGPTGGD